MRQIALVGVLVAAMAASAADRFQVPLARDGQPAATIVTARQPSVAAHFAALELQNHLRRITGATLPLVTDDQPVSGPRLLVGESAATRAAGLSTAGLKYQEYLVHYGRDTVALLGQDAAATVKDGGWPRAAGKFGRALECDGKTTLVSLTDPGFDDERGTLEAWVWMPAATSNRHGTILRLDGSGPWSYHIVQRDMNSSVISYTTYDGQNGHYLGSKPLAEGWHHVVATWDLATARQELFIDGVSVGTTKYVRTTCRRSTLHVGGLPNDSGPVGNPWRGLIDEVRLCHTVRTPQTNAAGGPYAVDQATTVLLHFDEERGQPVNAAGDTALSAALPALFDARGTLDATYDFLERECDVRWYAPTDLGTVTPSSRTLTVSGSARRQAPNMIHRWITPGTLYLPGPPDSPSERDVHLWKLRLRIGGQAFWVCHSFQGYFDHDLKAHPDWFAQGYGASPPQPCYTNPEFIARVVQDARNYFDGKGAPPGATAVGDVYGLVPMDNNSWCKCARCQAELNQAERKNQQFNNGIASDYIFGFVNKVAREVRKTHPNKWIGALAYSDYAYYPSKFKVESNVVIQTCLHTRNWWCPSMEVNDRKVLDDWRRQDPERPLYLWLYYCFPALNAEYGKFNYFPGYFAHTVVKQMSWYRERGIRGIFMEHSSEFSQSYLMDQLEFYVTLKLACDPTLDGDRLIDEFFARYYGAAARPMQQLYEAIEETFSNPRYYPAAIQTSSAHQHQTEALAWESLGTAARVAAWQKLMDQAKAAARTPAEKQRVAVFEQGQWQYVAKGRQRYSEHQQRRAKALPTVSVPKVAAPVAWDTVPAAPGWGDLTGAPTPRRLETKLAHDGQTLYLRLTEWTDPSRLVTGGALWDGDDFEVFTAATRGGDRHQLIIAPDGRHAALAWQGGAQSDWPAGAKVTSDRSAKDRWQVQVALPLKTLIPGGWQPGAKLYLNVYRASPGASNLLGWHPSFAGGFQDTQRLPELVIR